MRTDPPTRWRSTHSSVEARALRVESWCEIRACLDRARIHSAGDPFVMLDVTNQSSATFSRCVEEISATDGEARVCLAVRPDVAVRCLPVGHGGRISFMLDVVDDRLPWSAMAIEGIEAVRFDSDFAGRARRSLRASAVLEAMAGLARQLGLSTFGPHGPADERAWSSGLPFDYVPIETGAPVARAFNATGEAPLAGRPHA